MGTGQARQGKNALTNAGDSLIMKHMDMDMDMDMDEEDEHEQGTGNCH